MGSQLCIVDVPRVSRARAERVCPSAQAQPCPAQRIMPTCHTSCLPNLLMASSWFWSQVG